MISLSLQDFARQAINMAVTPMLTNSSGVTNINPHLITWLEGAKKVGAYEGATSGHLFTLINQWNQVADEVYENPKQKPVLSHDIANTMTKLLGDAIFAMFDFGLQFYSKEELTNWLEIAEAAGAYEGDTSVFLDPLLSETSWLNGMN
jgi:hypothetical protein